MAANEPPATEEQSQISKDADPAPVPRRTSAKQIEANRRNAVNSTGPTTVEGKQASRLNALKHGLRAKDVMIPGLEDPAGLEATFSELCDDWKPEGHSQIHLVEQIALAELRLQRVHRAELGEIRTQMASPAESDVEDEIEQAFDQFPARLPQILIKSTAGIAYLLGALEDAVDELDREGIVSEDACDYLDLVFGTGTDKPGPIVREWFEEEWPEEEGEEGEGNEEEEISDGESTLAADISEVDKKAAARKKTAARRYLKMALNDLDRQERKLQKKEKIELEIARQRQSIPAENALERFHRYETSIKREMNRDIDQLERLQRRRRGETLPPGVNVNISKDE